MGSSKKLGILAGLALALSACGAATASAASEFTASATGSLVGKALNTQEFTTNAGTVKCTTAKTTGTIASTANTEFHVTVHDTACTAYGFVSADITDATYLITTHTDGINDVNTTHVLNTVTINVTGAGCTQTITPQTVGNLTVTNNGGKIKLASNVTGIAYHSSGGLCGSSGTNGTYKGENEFERVGGGALSFDS